MTFSIFWMRGFSGDGSPRFPGHDAAQREWARRNEEQKINRKAFYRDAYNIPPGLGTYVAVTDEMRAERVVPVGLDQLVDDLSRLALSDS